jgi:hypothetical protein
MENSASRSFGSRLIAWVVLILAVVIVAKLVFGALIGLVAALFTILLVVGAIAAVLWALRRI